MVYFNVRRELVISDLNPPIILKYLGHHQCALVQCTKPACGFLQHSAGLNGAMWIPGPGAERSRRDDAAQSDGPRNNTE